MTYNFKEIEEKWRAWWAAQKKYSPDLEHAERPYYNLMMFPYPSAQGLHIGNMFSFIGSDVHGRFRRAQGYDVFEPMGFDAFGMHSENFALKTGSHPAGQTERNIVHFREEQLKRIGNIFDWSHEVKTTDPEYYRWTQWIFVQLFRQGLAYQNSAPVNWCPSCKTVLADEQAAGGACERCATHVERRELKQWFLRITAYAHRLLHNLESLDWSEITKATQRRWIGKSEGTEIDFRVDGDSEPIRIFTTRPDTLWGATFLVVSPEFPITPASERKDVVEKYRAGTTNTVDREANGEKTGVFTGRFAIHPGTGAQVPIWMADYVVGGYGTGAIMAVPAHDERDRQFAETYSLPVVTVIDEDQRLVGSGPFTGEHADTAMSRITEWCSERGIGGKAVRYHLHDWCISRQRYWGTPIPIIHCESCGTVPVAESQLPVVLPYIEDYHPDGSGVSPLARNGEFITTECPMCGRRAQRETDVCDNFLDSSWYYLRYPCTKTSDAPFDPELLKTWLPVDTYIGGNEHAVLHLMYSRFITMALQDAGFLPFDEPFIRFRANGMIVKDGAKMSKSKGNMIVPDEYLDEYGADVLRTYLMFAGNFAEGGDFRDSNIVGMKRFIERFWTYLSSTSWDDQHVSAETESEIHRRIKRVTDDIETLDYNTAIAAIMELLRIYERAALTNRHYAKTLISLLTPFAPFLCHELWSIIGEPGSPDDPPWPTYSDELIIPDVVEVAVQVNGKLKGSFTMPRESGEAYAVQCALGESRVVKALAGATPNRIVYVPDRLVNLVI